MSLKNKRITPVNKLNVLYLIAKKRSVLKDMRNTAIAQKRVKLLFVI